MLILRAINHDQLRFFLPNDTLRELGLRLGTAQYSPDISISMKGRLIRKSYGFCGPVMTGWQLWVHQPEWGILIRTWKAVLMKWYDKTAS
jgi:hypothetical protein